MGGGRVASWRKHLYQDEGNEVEVVSGKKEGDSTRRAQAG